MTDKQRLLYLKTAAVVILGVLVLDHLILEPGLRRWSAQSERIRALREDVDQAGLLLSRESKIRERWEAMQRTDLSPDVATAESEVFKAVARWGRVSRLTFTSLDPQWRTYDNGYMTLECRANATGDQAALARFLSELESDPLAVRLESCEMVAADQDGRRLAMAVRFTAMRLIAEEERPL
jgi:Tfp pilus assembly protein PilO